MPEQHGQWTENARRRNRLDLAKYHEQLARAVEPVIGHLKDHHRMGRNYFAHASGDAISAVLAAAGYNFRRLLAWLRPFVAQNPDCAQPTCSSSNPSEIGFFTADNSSLILSSRSLNSPQLRSELLLLAVRESSRPYSRASNPAAYSSRQGGSCMAR
jgi:hypothetical protein